MKYGLACAAVIALGVSHTAQGQSLPGDNVVLQWNEVTVADIAATKPAPTAAARMLAEVATAMYDAWTAFDPLAAPTQPGNGVGKVGGWWWKFNLAAKQQALSYAAYRLESDLFPGNTGPANALMASLGYDPTNLSTDPTTPAGIGNLAAAAIIAFRHNDGSNQLGDLNGGAPYSDYSGYVPANTPYVISNPNAWQPLAVTNAAGVTIIQKYATPFWGAVIPFATLPAFSGTGPSAYPNPQYAADAQTMLAYSAGLNDFTKMTAEYWADWPGSQLPPGHWSRFGELVSRRDHHSLDIDTQMFFALNNALLDAGISAWALKRTFNSERPITAIHYLYTGTPVYAWAGPGLGAQWIDGGNWLPYQPSSVITPPFPEYTSGHSTFSFAAAAVLQQFTGSDYFGLSVTLPAGSSAVEPGITPANPVTFNFYTFSYAATLAGLSRRYGGIHFPEGDMDGRADGYAVGQTDWTQAVTYFNGGTPCATRWHAHGYQSPWCRRNGYGGNGHGSGGGGDGDND